MHKYALRKDGLFGIAALALAALVSGLFLNDYRATNNLIMLIGAITVLVFLPTLFMWKVTIDQTGLATGYYCFGWLLRQTGQIDFVDIESVCMGVDKKSVFVYSASKRSWLTGRAAIVLKENLVNRNELLGRLLEKVPASKVVDSAVYEKASGLKL